MATKLMVSGSTILSRPTRFEELFWEGAHGVEIGHLPSRETLSLLASQVYLRSATWGGHAPLVQGHHKYGLLASDPEARRAVQTEVIQELRWVTELGGVYLVVHFPFVESDSAPRGEMAYVIDTAIRELQLLAEASHVLLLLEPKVGFMRGAAGAVKVNAGGIAYLWRLRELLPYWLGSPPEKTGCVPDLGLCLDIGDFCVAAELLGVPVCNLVEPFLPWCLSLHLHHVVFRGTQHIWTPIHPSPGEETATTELVELLPWLIEASNPEYVVFEHTPHIVPSHEYVREGFEWVRGLVD